MGLAELEGGRLVRCGSPPGGGPATAFNMQCSCLKHQGLKATLVDPILFHFYLLLVLTLCAWLVLALWQQLPRLSVPRVLLGPPFSVTLI